MIDSSINNDYLTAISAYLYICKYKSTFVLTRLSTISTIVDIKATLVEKEMKLSEFELEVMQYLWKHPESTAPEVHEQIVQSKEVTYSTVKTIIDRLEKKGAIERVRQVGRSIIYGPSIKPEALQKPMFTSFIDKVFGGNKHSLFAHLFKDDKLSDDDIDYLESLIKKHKTKQ
jgi:BlaI family transcriptional regulator, penicillinase repressor